MASRELRLRRFHSVVRLSLIVLAAFGLAVLPALPQTGVATVSGTVHDSSEGIVSGVKVTITNTETGISKQAETSAEGIYSFSSLPIGPYRVTVEKQGFETWVGTLTLNVGQSATVNPVLRPGSISSVVEVKDAASPIETTRGVIGDVRESSQIRDLPLNGRDVGLLFGLTAGVESGAGGARVNGMKVGSLDINLDGVTQVDRFGGGIVRVRPGIETIQEFRIETSGSDASFAQPATVIMATRSGTNQLHFAAYEYNRDNTVVAPTRLRSDPVDVQVPQLIRNEFGGYVGGPVIIPHLYHGRDKTFWLFDYEGLRDHERSDTFFPFVPTPAMWNGDLSNAIDPGIPCNPSGPNCTSFGYAPIKIYDPTTTDPNTFQRQQFPNNQIPGPLNQTAAALKALTALPTNNNNPFNYNTPNFTSTYPNIGRTNTYTIKVDQNFTDKDRLSVRYTRSWQNSAIEGGYFANPIDTSSGMGTSARDYYLHNIHANYTRTISATWLNELLVGVNRSAVHYGTSADSTDWPTKLGLPNPFNATGWPTMYTCEADGCNAFFGWDSDNVHNQNLTSETLDDNVTWTRGKHTIQFGFRGRREQNNVRENQQAQGSHEWDPAYTTNWDPTAFGPAADTGSGFAELLLGLPDYLSNQYNRGYFYFRQTQLGLYANDRIRLTPKLTLSLGLRWDYWTPYTEARHRLVVPYNPETTFEVVSTNVPVDQIPGIPPAVLTSWASTGLTWTTAKSVGYPSNLFRSVPHDFGPRVGIAYQINRNTVIRGAYGRYYVGMPLSLILQSTRNNPPLNLRFENNAFNNTNVPGGAGGCYDGVYPYISRPASSDYLPAATVDINQPRALSPFGNAATYWDPRQWDDEHQQTWNVTLEHELPAQIGLRMSYIGTYGGNLEQQFSIDPREPIYNYTTRTGLQPPAQSNKLRAVPGWGLIGINHTGFSHDHSAQVEVRRKFANGMSFQWFYTYVRALTTTDPSGFSDGNTSVNGGGGSGNIFNVGGGGGATVPENIELLGEPSLSYSQRLRLVYFNNTTIPPHRITFNGIFDLPFGRGKRFGNNISTPLNYVVGGWQLAAIGSWNSGLWMGVNPGYVQTGKIRISGDKRAIVTLGGTDLYRQWFAGNFNPTTVTAVSGTVAAPSVRPAGPNCSGAFIGQLAVTLSDGSCFNAPFSGFYNPDSRVNFIGPGAWNDDLSIYKHFKVREHFDIRFAADFFNAFNHPNDVPPNTISGFQNLGLQANSPRVLQFSLRMEY